MQDARIDDHRSGRPPKLDESAFETFEPAVIRPPKQSGYEQPAWSVALVQRVPREEVGGRRGRNRHRILDNEYSTRE